MYRSWTIVTISMAACHERRTLFDYSQSAMKRRGYSLERRGSRMSNLLFLIAFTLASLFWEDTLQTPICPLHSASLEWCLATLTADLCLPVSPGYTVDLCLPVSPGYTDCRSLSAGVAWLHWLPISVCQCRLVTLLISVCQCRLVRLLISVCRCRLITLLISVCQCRLVTLLISVCGRSSVWRESQLGTIIVSLKTSD